MVRRRMSGEGSIFPYKGGYRVQVSKGSRGDRKYVTRTARTKAEARLKLAALQAEGAVAGPSSPLGAYLVEWVRDARDIKATTRHGYEVVVSHLRPIIGHVPLDELTPLHVEAALTELTPRMSRKTLRNVHAALRRALGQAVRKGLVSRNVAAREFVDAPKVTTAEPRALSPAEVRRLIAACQGDRLAALYLTAVGTGLRQGELLGLAWEDVDLERATIHVRHELVYRAGKYALDEPKTPQSKRTVPLAPAVVAAIRAHREALIAEGFVPTATGPVFANRKGRDLSGSWVTHHFYALLERAGIPRLPFKNLRTTFGSRLHEAGVSDMEIARLMGHARTHTTKRHYISLDGTSQAPAVAAIERLVG